MSKTQRNLIEGRPVLIVIDIRGGASTSDERSSLEYLRTGARRISGEVMTAFEQYQRPSIAPTAALTTALTAGGPTT